MTTNSESMRKAGQAAEDLLIQSKSVRIPTDVKGIIEGLPNVRLRSYRWFMQKHGINSAEMLSLTRSDSGICFIMPDSGRALLLYNDEQPRARIRFTAAHELGHAVLGHHTRTDYGLCEREANRFAQALLMPAPVLMALDVRSAEAIMELCAVSYEAACNAHRFLTVCYKRSSYIPSPLVQLYSSFISESAGRFGRLIINN